MFPLKRRRKFARINKKGLTAVVVFEGTSFNAKVKDISASGCNISFVKPEPNIPVDGSVIVSFTLNDIDFSFKASKVRENSFNFLFEDRELQTKLNNEILVEYFKDTPELIPVDKNLK